MPAAIITRDSIGVFLPRPEESVYDQLEPLYTDCQLVIVEGNIDASGKKIEVWRAAAGNPCLAAERDDILAVVSDDSPEVTVPIWPRGDISHLADQLLASCKSERHRVRNRK